MNEKQSMGMVTAGLCLLVLIFRTGNPLVFERFDWMALVLFLLAILCLWMPYLSLPKRKGERQEAEAIPDPTQETIVATVPKAQMDALMDRLSQADWPRETGGMYDALTALGETRPLEAAAAARGMLTLLLHQAAPGQTPMGAPFALKEAGRLSQDDAVTLSQLLEALDALLRGTASEAAEETAGPLLNAALLAMARLEHMA